MKTPILVESLTRILQALQKNHKKFALVGGLAVSNRTEPRFTRDIDFAVATHSDKDAEQFASLLGQEGYNVHAIFEQKINHQLGIVRFVPKSTDNLVFVDILFSICGIEKEIVEQAETVHLFLNIHLPVAQIGHLLALKTLSVDESRLQDRIDIKALLKVATKQDLDLAREAVKLITERGFAGHKNLVQDLESYVAADEN